MIQAVATKVKKCRNPACRSVFTPARSMQTVCTMACALALTDAKKNREAKERRKTERLEHREAKERIKSKGDYAKEAQAAFNAYIRIRDERLPCVSCGRHHQGQWHAGHYRTVAGSPELRFEQLNVHKQCAPCNNHKSGDIVNYRAELLRRIGAEAVEWLEGPHEPKRYTIDDLKAIKAMYRAITRDLRKATQ